MIYTHYFNGVPLATGDIICTVDGVPGSLYGEFWRQVGRMLPGEVDHCAIYLGPEGRCVEAGPSGVIVYEMANQQWDACALANQRRFVDSFYGVAYPLSNRGLSLAKQHKIRKAVAIYCLEQAVLEKPYNFVFPNPETENAFYCSQLVYKAYLEQGIDLKTPLESRDEGIGLLNRIVFPEEIWNNCVHRRCKLNRSEIETEPCKEK
jgi:hypothetical protein